MKRLFLSLIICIACNCFVFPKSFIENHKNHLKSLVTRLKNRGRKKVDESQVLYIVPSANDVGKYLTISAIEKNGEAWQLIPSHRRDIVEENGIIQFLIEGDTIYKIELPWDIFSKITIDGDYGSLALNNQLKAHYIDLNGKSLNTSQVRRNIIRNNVKVEKLVIGWLEKGSEEKSKRIFDMSELSEIWEDLEHEE
jgi:hypothetical protein